MTPLIVTPEQKPVFDRALSLHERLGADPAVWNDKATVDAARAMLGEVEAVGIPTRTFVMLQIIVSRWDRERALPPHLREPWFSE